MNIINIDTDGWETVNITINLALLIFLAVLITLLFIFRKKTFLKRVGKTLEIDGASLGIGNCCVHIVCNKDDVAVAYKLWVELSTRKIGLKIDLENDVIYELYNSWYVFFGVARELLKNISPCAIKNCSQLIEITQKVLNDGLRSHLTKWQAKFRRWYDAEKVKEENSTISPQELQRKYYLYDELANDLLKTSDRLVAYTNLMFEMCFEKSLDKKAKK